MSDGGRIASLILQLFFAVLLIFYGINQMVEDWRTRDEPFAEYESLDDCIAKNWNKRDPKQYCLAIKRKVERVRRRKYGNV